MSLIVKNVKLFQTSVRRDCLTRFEEKFCSSTSYNYYIGLGCDVRVASDAYHAFPEEMTTGVKGSREEIGCLRVKLMNEWEGVCAYNEVIFADPSSLFLLIVHKFQNIKKCCQYGGRSAFVVLKFKRTDVICDFADVKFVCDHGVCTNENKNYFLGEITFTQLLHFVADVEGWGLYCWRHVLKGFWEYRKNISTTVSYPIFYVHGVKP